MPRVGLQTAGIVSSVRQREVAGIPERAPPPSTSENLLGNLPRGISLGVRPVMHLTQWFVSSWYPPSMMIGGHQRWRLTCGDPSLLQSQLP
jgi:hypothetical protein